MLIDTVTILPDGLMIEHTPFFPKKKHADATADDLSRKLKKLGFKNPSPEGRPKCDWVIVDAGSVIVHLFKKEIRELYNLEQLWEVNFDSEKSKLAH